MTDQPDVKERLIEATGLLADPGFWIRRGPGGVAETGAKEKGERAEALSPLNPVERPARSPPFSVLRC